MSLLLVSRALLVPAYPAARILLPGLRAFAPGLAARGFFSPLIGVSMARIVFVRPDAVDPNASQSFGAARNA